MGLTTPDDEWSTGTQARAREGLEHLQAAARELIEAARAALDVAEEVVNDPESLASLAGHAGHGGRRGAPRDRHRRVVVAESRDGRGSGGRRRGRGRRRAPRVQRITVT